MSNPGSQQPSARAASLADKFDQINGDVMAFVRECPADRWQQLTDSEGWPLGVVALHVAGSYRAISGWFRSLAQGQPVALTMDDINGANAQLKAHAEAHPEAYAQATVLAHLEANGRAASDAVRALSDAELDSQADFGPAGHPLSAEQVIKYVLFVHPREHLASMRAALEHAQG